MKRSALPVLGILLASSPVHAHHGVASVGFSDPEGPGVGLETTAAMPLPRSLGFALVKTELVSFQARDDRAAFPEQKDIASFNVAALGFGITPWLSAYLFQPYKEVILDQETQQPVYGPAFSSRSVLGTVMLVYNTFLGPLSLGVNYYDKQADAVTFNLNFGYILFNRKALP